MLPKGISGGEGVNYWHGTGEKTGKKGVWNGSWKELILLANQEEEAVVFSILPLTTWDAKK